MLKHNLFIGLLIFCINCQYVAADDEINAALLNTQDCLRNQNCDAAKTPAGKAANRQALETVTGNPANQQAIYNLSADILPILVQQSGGDPAKMQAILMKAQTDPAGFLSSLPTDIRTKIQSLSNAVGSNSTNQGH